MGDIARLRWNDLNAETIVFEIQKTKLMKHAAPVKIIAEVIKVVWYFSHLLTFHLFFFSTPE